jgi:hypothetical protein
MPNTAAFPYLIISSPLQNKFRFLSLLGVEDLTVFPFEDRRFHCLREIDGGGKYPE